LSLKLPFRSIGNAGWACIDQGLFAASNFALNLLLARWLDSNEYGLFTVGYTVLLLIATFHTALLTEPMLVFGSGKYRDHLGRYLGVVSLAHWVGMAFFTILAMSLGVIFWYTGNGNIAQIICALGFAGPSILFLWIMRRACYTRLNPSLAGYAGVLYLVLMVLQIMAIFQIGWLSMSLAFGILGSASLITGVWLAVQLRMEWPSFRKNELLKQVGTDHWSYGRWSIMTGILMWVPSQIFYFILPLWVGLEEVAGLRALVNLIIPYTLICTALGTVLIPTLVSVQGQPFFQKLMRKYLFFLIGAGALYWLCIGLASTTLIEWMYNGLYLEYANLLWILGGVSFFSGIIAIFGSVLRALQKPNFIFWSYVCSSVVALTVGLGLAAVWGIFGAVLGMIISYATTAVVLIGLYVKKISLNQKDHKQDVVWA
jgi:O-antigen/teichoic acid export membrane protein